MEEEGRVGRRSACPIYGLADRRENNHVRNHDFDSGGFHFRIARAG